MKKSVKLFSVIISLVMVITSVFVPVSAYAQGYLKGVDVSEHNSNVDFVSLKNQGYDFAMIRLGYSDKYLDKDFYKNVQNASNAGMKFGVYLYSYAYNTAEAQAEADFVISTLAGIDPAYKQNMVLPVAYDLEDKKIINEGGCDKAIITNMALTFCNSLKSAGYDTMVYANDNWFKNYIDINQLNANGIKIWYAYWTNTESSNVQYVKDTSIPCYMWQYQSGSNNSVNGLDQNILFINDMALMNVSLSFTSVTYDGYEKFPIASVYYGNQQLVNGVDYTVSYVNNLNAGTASVIVSGIGAYSGTVAKNFTINPIALDSSNANVRLSKSKFKYDGTQKKPTVAVYDTNGNRLSSDNYTLKYSGNANPGKKKVTITLTGNYSGTIVEYYNVIPKTQTISSVKSPSYKRLKVSWKKDSTVSGYQIQYSTYKNFSSNKKLITVSKSNTSKTIKTSQSGKTYYVRLRAYKTIDGKKVYGSWSKVKSVKVK